MKKKTQKQLVSKMVVNSKNSKILTGLIIGIFIFSAFLSSFSLNALAVSDNGNNGNNSDNGNNNSSATIQINTVNDNQVPFNFCTSSPLKLTGSGTLVNPVGNVGNDQYKVQIDWGDGVVEDNIPVIIDGSNPNYTFIFSAGQHTTSAESTTI